MTGMTILLLGLSVGTFGKLLLGFAVWRVHEHILEEHKIDGIVLGAIRRERYITLAGVALILAGYILEMAFYTGAPFMVPAGL